MNTSDKTRRQILISGVGGQGVLFVTRLLAQAAMAKNLPVLTAETHGMAQRGGTVVSHLKVGDFSSPLIRPGKADGLVALKPEIKEAYFPYLRDKGWTVVSRPETDTAENASPDSFVLNAQALADKIRQPKSVNLVVLGFAAASGRLFCGIEDLKQAVCDRFSKPEIRQAALAALMAGHDAFA